MKTHWFTNKFKLSVAAVLTLLATSANAQESKVPVPWENIVSANDTAVFWVLASFAVLLLILIWVVVGVTKGLLSDNELWKSKWDGSTKTIAVLIGTGLLFTSNGVFAQAAEAGSPMFQMSDGLFWIMVVVDAFLLLVLLGMIYNLNSLIRSLRTSTEEEAAVVEESMAESIWTGSLSGAVPIEHEEDILLDHDYDGIRELDNKLPPWWLYMFYFTIVFGVVYVGYYHFSGGLSQEEEYAAEMALAEEQKAAFLASSANNVDENNVELLTDATAIANGKEKFQTLCIACHGASGGSMPGGVGPNLTDQYWLHGGGIKNVFKTIKYGVPAKGMISWEAQLTPRQIQEVASYVLSLQGSNPENAREPQGEIWTEEAAEPAAPAETEEAPVAEAETADAGE